MAEELLLENDQACALVLPGHGAGLARFDLRLRGRRLPVFRPLTGAPRAARDLALFLLAPFSNRIAPAGFDCNGQRHRLAPNVPGEPCPLHGDAWQRPWSVTEHSRSHARLQLRSTQLPPFDYSAQIDWQLAGPALCATLTLTHCGALPLPYGGGFHPWFVRDSDVQLQAPASGWWAEDALHLPTHWQALTGAADNTDNTDNTDDAGHMHDFRQPRRLPPGFVNALFGGWNGQARIVWPQRALALEISAQAPLDRYVFYSPGAAADFFCFEPVSHDIAAHNHPAPAQAGLAVLHPGQSLQLCARFAASAL